MIIYAKSAFRHGITHEQIDDILRSTYSEIFDADKATKAYQRLFNQRKGNES